MTLTTDSRQLRLLIDSVLSKHQIDNLELSMLLVQACQEFFAETKQGHDPVEVRQKIAEAIGVGEANVSRQETMRTRIEKALVLTLLPNAESLIDFCLKKDAKGETIERYAAWCKADPYNSPKAHQVINNPLLVIGTWPQAFTVPEDTSEYRTL